MTKLKAFLSHASDDKDRFVRAFAKRLMAHGVDVWLDEWEINPGDNPVRKIFDEGLAGCEIVILVMSAKSIQKPWVREELDAAFVKKVEGRAKLIPIRLDGCDMPECLKTTRWESIDDLDNYDTEFQRILNALFGHYPKPPIGQPPPYAQQSVLPITGLNQVDSLLFEKGCQIAIDQGHSLINLEPWLQALDGLGLNDEQIADSQKMLEESRYIELLRTMGPHEIYSFKITLFGFQTFAEVGVPGFDSLVSEVAAVLVRKEHMSGNSIARALSQPLRIIEHILELLESRDLIKLSRIMGGDYMNVSNVSARLRRAVSDS
jgi:TIR domain